MTTQDYIDKNKTGTFKAGDNVVMHTCGEATHYNGKIWTCMTDSYKSNKTSELVFLEKFSGSFNCEYLQLVKLTETKD